MQPTIPNTNRFSRFPLLLVSGMSGAGMSSTLKLLEDLGYETVDNLPFNLFKTLVDDPSFIVKPMAIGVDTRNRDFSALNILEEVQFLKKRADLSPSLLFLECDDDRLIERFKTNRRRHPLAIEKPIREGIQIERVSLASLKNQADIVIDTTFLAVKDLKRVLEGNYRLSDKDMMISVISFSYRRGIPREADLVIDARFLSNPYYDLELRPLDGRNPKIAHFIREDKDYESFLGNLQKFLEPLLNRFQQEGKSYLTFAIGCTGGRHRSVFVTEELGFWLKGFGWQIVLHHRDIAVEHL